MFTFQSASTCWYPKPPHNRVSFAERRQERRKQFVLSHQGLRLLWIASRLPMRDFLRKYEWSVSACAHIAPNPACVKINPGFGT